MRNATVLRLVLELSKAFDVPHERVLEVVERVLTPPNPERSCEHCGVTHTRRGVYCSEGCKAAAYRERKAAVGRG